MRTLIVADVVGGVRTFAAGLARELSRREVEVHLALIGPRRGAQALADLPVASWAQRDLRLEWMEDPWDDVDATADWVGELVERHRPDLLHMNTFTPVLDPHLPVMLTAHSCVLTWWRAVQGQAPPPAWNRYRSLVCSALERAALTVFPTRALARQFEGEYGRQGRVRVIANGRSVCRRTAAREPLVITAGRLWDEAKNVRAVAAAAPTINGRLVAIGAGGGGAGELEWTGELEEAQVLDWLGRAAVFAEPARYEPFGLSALEAALCGCALVLGDIPSLREVWGDGADYVPADDPDALARAVNRLLSDPRGRAQRAAAAAARAARYTPAAQAEAYLEAMHSLAAGAVVA